MRVSLVTLDFAPHRSSGLAVYAESVAQGLVDRGHAVTVVASRRPEVNGLGDEQLSRDIEVIRVPSGRADWIGLGWQAARYLRSQRTDYDIVHFLDVHFAYAYRGPFVASAFQSFRQRLTSHHGRPYHTNRRNLLFRLIYYRVARLLMERPSVRRASHLIMPSAATRQEFIDHYGVQPERTTLVYPGIDLRRFSTLPEQTEARQVLGLPSNERILLYVGFSTPRKGVEYLAEALRNMQTPARLVVVGKWELGYVERFLDALGDAHSRVHLVGYVPDEDLATYFASADLFVLPTLLEGFGIPLVEAMAAGVPIVTTNAGSAGEVAGDAGLVVPRADSRELALALDRVLSQPALAQQMSRTGRERARGIFDQDRMTVQLETVYQQILTTAGTSAL